MVKHVRNVNGVIKGFVFKEAEHARTSNGSLSYQDYDVLYSYRMPIAWRKDDGTIVVRGTQDSPSITTTRHINRTASITRRHKKHAISAPVSFIQGLGLSVENFLHYSCEDRMSKISLKIKGEKYTIITLKASETANVPFVVRNTTTTRFVVREDLHDLIIDDEYCKIMMNLYPDEESLVKAYDGWVAYTGKWFFVGQPDVKTKDLEGSVKKRYRFDRQDRDYSATEGCDGLVRGVIRKRGVGTLFSFKKDGRNPDKNFWYKPVKAKISPLPVELSNKFYHNALPLKELIP